MKRYADDMGGGHAFELYKLEDGRFRVRVTNKPELKDREWFGRSESDATQTALTDIQRMEERDEV